MKRLEKNRFGSGPRSQAQGAAERKWVALKQWSGGTGRKQTEKFTTAQEEWRVSWKVGAGDPDPIGTIRVYVRDGAGHLVTMASNLGQKIESGNFKVHAKPGEYYLEIEGADRKWSVTVEQ